MGSHLDFQNFGGDDGGNGSNLKPLVSFPLARQSSIYSLTFDELQNTFGGSAKDFGSMNMDELLKNISTAEETQLAFMTAGGGGEVTGPLGEGNLQRQGSLTLPRTLSQKTVDEVWRDLLKETDGGAKDVSGGSGGGANLPQRQQTLGEMTLEEFLARAGVVREDMQQIGISNNGGFFGNNSGLGLGFQELNRNNGFLSNNNSVINQQQPPSLPLNMGGAKSPQLQQQQQQPKQQQQQQQHQPLFPKQQTVGFSPPMQLLNTTPQRANPGARGSMVGITDPSLNSNRVQQSQPTGLQSGGRGIIGLGSPASQITSDVVSNSSAYTSPLSPVPYAFGRGRKCGAALEKVVERRQRRMIKNRESAARSRARKQAYTLELEAEIAKLKEMNEELQKKHEEVMEMQKNKMMETLDRHPWRAKRQCLRRTLTGPW